MDFWFGTTIYLITGGAAAPQSTFSATPLASTYFGPVTKDNLSANGSATVTYSGRTPDASLYGSILSGNLYFNGDYAINFDTGAVSCSGNMTVDGFGDHISEIDYSPDVPEPATWAMMLLGLGAVGAAVRAGRQAGERAAIA